MELYARTSPNAIATPSQTYRLCGSGAEVGKQPDWEVDNALFWRKIALLDHGLRAFFLTGNSMTLVALKNKFLCFPAFS